MSHCRQPTGMVARIAIRRLVPAVFLAAGSAACAAGSSSGSPLVDGTQVAVGDRSFEPSALTVGTGDTVTWVWDEPKLHNVSGEGFRSGDRRSGTFRYTFEEPGTYPYECTLHPGMGRSRGRSQRGLFTDASAGDDQEGAMTQQTLTPQAAEVATAGGSFRRSPNIWLWLLVVFVGIQFGAGLYEHR